MSQRSNEDGSKCNQFFLKRDLYANPINLTYNTKKNYQTAYGGVLTIISAIIVISWLAAQALNVK